MSARGQNVVAGAGRHSISMTRCHRFRTADFRAALWLAFTVLARSVPALPGWALVTECQWFETGNLVLVNAQTLARTTIATGGVSGACFSPDGQRIAYPLNGVIYVINSDRSGTPIQHRVNCQTKSNLSWVERNGKQYIYWLGANNPIKRVEIGTSTVETLNYWGSEIWGTISRDGSRGGLSVNTSWDPNSVDLINNTMRLVGNGTQCQAGISIDGNWVCGNKDGHRQAVICRYWTHDQVYTIGLPPGTGEFNVHRFSHTTPDYIMFTADGNKAYTCAWRTNTAYYLGSGFAQDYFPGEIGQALPAVAAPVISPAGGMVTQPSVQVTITCATAGVQVRYTTNGADPTATTGTAIASGASFTLAVPEGGEVLVKARGFKDGMAPSPVTEATFARVTLREPDNPASVAAGLDYQYFEGTYTNLAAMRSAAPAASGTASAFDIGVARRADNFGLRFRGFVSVPRDGIYSFYTVSDDSSELRIGGVLVVANNWQHGERRGQIGLRQGLHAVELLYQQGNGAKSLSVSYEGPSLAKSPVPQTALCRDVTGATALALLSPGGGETYAQGEVIEIRWQADCGIVASVAVKISLDDGDSWTDITGGASIQCDQPAWGAFQWRIPATLDGRSTVSNACRIRVAEYNGTRFVESARAFTIQGPAVSLARASGRRTPATVADSPCYDLSGRAVRTPPMGRARRLKRLTTQGVVTGGP